MTHLETAESIGGSVWATHGERELFVAAAEGDFAAFEQIVQNYHQAIYRTVFGMLGSSSDAEEVVQETFLSLFKNLHAFKFHSSAKTYLWRIAVNCALMRLRSKKRKPALALEDFRSGCDHDDVALPNLSVWSQLPDEAMLSHELRSHIEAALDRLPEKYRLVVLLRDVEGHTTEEVAEALGLTLPTVKSRLHRARVYLRRELDDYFRK